MPTKTEILPNTPLTQLPDRLYAEPARVVIRPFQVGPVPQSAQDRETSRMKRIFDAVLAMDEATCEAELALVDKDFTSRHWQTKEIYIERFHQVEAQLGLTLALSLTRQELIGAYFCHEYSYASAALMNPSIVPHPDQSGLNSGQQRIIMSLRAVGEGHISSIVFREGIISTDGSFTLLPQPSFSVALRPIASDETSITAKRFEKTPLSGSVLFPMTAQQRNGLEDLRLTKFTEDDGRTTYYGTYTAYNGYSIASELLITDDFESFRLQSLTGAASGNKGMALFPRKINGSYMMIGRQDGENIFLHSSDTLTHWNAGHKIITPRYPWELVQMGNCGAPIELDEGWLLLTHGVGAMRKYAIGAALLDKKDPGKVLARSIQPILAPQDEEREGYVPNVVYTCGATLVQHNRRQLFMPYGIADSAVAFSWIDVDILLQNMA